MRTIFTASQDDARKPEFANETIEKRRGIAPRPEQTRNQLQFLDIQLEQVAIAERPEHDLPVEERFPQIEIGHSQGAGCAGRRDRGTDGGSRDRVTLRQGSVNHHGRRNCHRGSLRCFFDEIPRRGGSYVIDRTAGARANVDHARRTCCVPLHLTGVDASFRELAAQIVPAGIATDARKKRDRNGARIGQMKSNIGRRTSRAFTRRKQVDQTLTDAKDKIPGSLQREQLYGLTGVGRGVIVGLGVGVGRGVIVGLGTGVGRGVIVGLGTGVGRGVIVGLGTGVGRGVIVGLGAAAGAMMGSGPGSTKEVVAVVGAGAIEGMAPIGERGRLAMRVVEAWLISVIWVPPVELEMVVAPLLTAPSSTTINPSPSVKGSPSVVVTIPEPATEATVTLPPGSVAEDALT